MGNKYSSVQPNMIEYIVAFDLDGTLFNTDYANNMAYQQATFDITGCKVNLNCGRVTRETIQSKLNVGEEITKKIATRKEVIFPNYLHLTSPLPGFFLLKHLNVPSIILLTNARRKRAEMVLSYYNAIASFNNMYYREDYSGISKFEYLMNEYDCNPNSIILFENEDDMVQEANKFGIPMKNIFKV